MQTARPKKSSPDNGKRSFTWGLQVSDISWMKPGAAGQAIDGSTASDCIAITPTDKRRRRKPAPGAAA
jgi:hypothetical protein